MALLHYNTVRLCLTVVSIIHYTSSETMRVVRLGLGIEHI